MKIISLNLHPVNSHNSHSSPQVLATLSKSGVLLHPTETCYGLAVDIFQQQALEKLYAIKQMKEDKPVSIMVKNLEQAERYGVFNDLARRLAQQFWPGPLTIIVPRKNKRRNKTETSQSELPLFLNPGTTTIGFRCPDHDFTQSMLQAYSNPLATTSANISGFPEAYDIDTYLQQVCEYYKVTNIADIPAENLPDLIINADTLPRNPPSTIVDVSDITDAAKAVILRQGSLAKEITTFLAEKFSHLSSKS